MAVCYRVAVGVVPAVRDRVAVGAVSAVRGRVAVGAVSAVRCRVAVFGAGREVRCPGCRQAVEPVGPCWV